MLKSRITSRGRAVLARDEMEDVNGIYNYGASSFGFNLVGDFYNTILQNK